MALKSRSKDNILTIYFADTRILDESKMREISNDLQTLLDKTDEEQIVLDFRCVEFMSSAMLGKLVQIHKRCKEYKASLKLCGINSEIRKVFKITKLDKLFDIYSDEDSARAAFGKRGWFGA